MTIEERQNEIIEEFSMLEGDPEMVINYVMELGDQLDDFPEAKRTAENEVRGCQSKVWLLAALNEQDQVRFQADSNTAITKGLVSLLVRVFSGQRPAEILDGEIFFPEKIGMSRFIGTQRSNGFQAMIKQMKLFALALTTQTKTQA